MLCFGYSAENRHLNQDKNKSSNNKQLLKETKYKTVNLGQSRNSGAGEKPDLGYNIKWQMAKFSNKQRTKRDRNGIV